MEYIQWHFFLNIWKNVWTKFNKIYFFSVILVLNGSLPIRKCYKSVDGIPKQIEIEQGKEDGCLLKKIMNIRVKEIRNKQWIKNKTRTQMEKMKNHTHTHKIEPWGRDFCCTINLSSCNNNDCKDGGRWRQR